MTNKQYLRQYRALDARLELALANLQRARARAERLTSALRPDGGGGRSLGSTGDALLAAYLDEREEFEREVRELTARKKRILRSIERLRADCPEKAETYRAVLQAVYISGKRLPEAAEMLHYSERQLARLHGEALRCLEQVPLEQLPLGQNPRKDGRKWQ